MIRLLTGDCREVLRTLPDESVHCAVTSPPYWNLRDYGVDGQIGLEGTPQEYVTALVGVFREVRRVLHSSGVVFLNLGDTYAGGGRGRGDKGYAGPIQSTNAGSVYLDRCPDVQGVRPKNLMMIPARVAMALQDDGWYLRAAIPWIKRNGMPGSQKDRPTVGTETVYLLAKSGRYYWDQEAVKVASTQQTGRAVDFKRTTKDHLLPGQAAIQHREERDSAQDNGARFRRDIDWFFDSMKVIFDGGQGMMLDDDGNPLALVVNTNGYKGAHFATFPPLLVEPMIKAATSERGCCSKCGAPWERIVERHEITRPRPDGSARERNRGGRTDGFTKMPNGVAGVDTTTTGWRPTCECWRYAPDLPMIDDGKGGYVGFKEPYPTKPAVVLDPFGGSGTVGLVADRLGRDAILIDLNPEYSEMQRARVTADAPMFAQVAGGE